MSPSQKRRVVVTGVGAVSSIGQTAEDFWSACLAGETRVERIPRAWLRHGKFSSTLWSPPPPLDLGPYPITRLEEIQQDRVALAAMVAAFQALSSAAISWTVENPKRNTLKLEGLNPERVLVAAGTGIGGVSSLMSNYQFHILGSTKAQLRRWIAEDEEPAPRERRRLEDLEAGLEAPGRMSPLVVPMSMPNTAAGALSIKFSLHGPAHTHCSACAAGTVAIGRAFQDLRSGRADVALAGGAEWMDDTYGGLFRAFDVARTLVQNDDPDRANRPFDEGRSGFLFSAGGAAFLVLEEREHARRRGAPILAEVAGFAESSDAHNIMAPAPGGRQIERAVRSALEEAALAPEDIGYINAHGTGTVANDATEAEIIHRIFGSRPAVSSTKSLLGHTLGASGALEAVVTVLSLRDQKVHACRGLERPIADLTFVRQASSLCLKAALSQSFAFGGHNAVLVLKEP